MKGTKNPINFFRTARYRRKNKKKTFPYYGIKAFMGEFGSGKTLSAVKNLIDINKKYPKAIIISNTKIKGIENIYYFETAEEMIKLMRELINEENKNGYIIFIDELHVVLSALFGSSDPIFLTYLSQLRKLGVVIIRNMSNIQQMSKRCKRLSKTVRRDHILQKGMERYNN